MYANFINLEEVTEFYREDFPNEARQASAATLSRFAFLGRKAVQDVIDDKMEVHSRSFVRASTRYEGAKYGTPIENQVARFGTLAKERSTGWIEQPVAGPDRRKRQWGKKARRGGRSVVQQKYRFKASKNIPSLAEKKSWPKLMSWIEKNEYFDLPVLIEDNEKGIYEGVFKFMRRRKTVVGADGRTRKVRTMIRLASRQRNQVKKVDIIGEAWTRVTRGHDMIDVFADNLRKGLNQKMNRRTKR